MVVLSGHLTSDAVLRNSKDGNLTFLTLTLAVNGNNCTEYVDCTYFGKGIEKMKLDKGKHITVSGTFRERKLDENLKLTINSLSY